MDTKPLKLVDYIVSCSKTIKVHDANGKPKFLPGVGQKNSLIESCPVRYILDSEASSQCMTMLIEQGDLLSADNKMLRVPSPLLWIESVINKPFSIENEINVGFLVESDEEGRAGSITSYFRSRSGKVEVSPAYVQFDLENKLFRPNGDENIFNIKHGNIKSLEPILEHTLLCIDPFWSRHYKNEGKSSYSSRLSTAAEGTWYAFPFVLSFCVLMSIKGLLNKQPAKLGVINSARRKRGRAELLDHIEVRMNISTDFEATHQKGISNADRSAPRLHLVRGHVVRRGDKMFWRSTHFRGDIKRPITSKTVLVNSKPKI